MMSSFTLSPSCAMSSMNARGNRHRRHTTENWSNYTCFALAMFSLALTIAYQQGELHPNYGKRSSLFLGTAPVTAAVATAVFPRAGRPTAVSMAAGSSRTLIELVDPAENDKNVEFKIEVTYLEDDDEQGLMVLRRANTITDTGHDGTKSGLKDGHAFYRRAVRLLKNPVVAVVLAGNVVSMIGILSPGITGFLPAMAILLNKTKWCAPILRQLRSFRFRATLNQVPVLKTVLTKLKVQLGKVISHFYKNRSEYSVLSDYLGYVDFGEETSKHKNGNRDNDGEVRPSSTHKAIA